LPTGRDQLHISKYFVLKQKGTGFAGALFHMPCAHALRSMLSPVAYANNTWAAQPRVAWVLDGRYSELK
jgi:hypothetical protein